LFVDADQIAFDWQKVAPFLGRKREFWTWLLGVWGYLPEPDAR
jgi:hypothetical protein